MSEFAPGDFLPGFRADSNVNPDFWFNAMAGRAFVLAFVGSVAGEPGRSLAQALLTQAEWLRARKLQVVVVTSDTRETDDPTLDQVLRHFTVFWDADRRIARLFGQERSASGAGTGKSIFRLGVLLVRPNLRMHAAVPVNPLEGFAERLHAAAASLPEPEPERLVQSQAPVLLIPDVLDPATCRRFIEHYEQHGGFESGFMRDVDGRTQEIIDPTGKRRKDLHIKDPELRQLLRYALARRVVPEIRKAFSYPVTRIEREMIACYDAADLGFFDEHRDNRTKATAHRAFAVTLNLNAEDYDGGTLRFPEYGLHAYKPATGAAAVFSCSLLHQATPVTRGRRYVVLPFLYDDAAAARRTEGMRFLNEGPPLRENDWQTAPTASPDSAALADRERRPAMGRSGR